MTPNNSSPPTPGGGCLVTVTVLATVFLSLVITAMAVT